MTSKFHGAFLASALVIGLQLATVSYQLRLVGDFLRSANGIAARIVQQASARAK